MWVDIDSNNRLMWRLTPWDKRAFGINTSELLDIQYTNKLDELFTVVDQYNQEHNIKLSFFRHDANDRLLKKHAIERGFQLTECTLTAVHNNISKVPKSPLKLTFSQAQNEHLSDIQTIAGDSFRHGRFHEDPFVPLGLAQLRYEYWIKDLLTASNMYIFHIKDRVGGFFTYNIKDDYIEMPISGLSQDALRLGGFLWSSMIHFIHEKEHISKMKNVISAANVDVLNLYTKLGFNITYPVFGYHKYYSSEGEIPWNKN
ncbi:hypothetical protein BBG47_19375 [Paenibacillus sp. KS1]|uniref:hypothetical protein n=1 Tax=Paenibacillus sp. KS1 TaxID=1849249 RepID=UPI0008066ADD|nr:hypothetical protein [Paenibacillus sp. KS1]OBY77881.1 hypothetical protein BBG47_19375 [Paenibacillus sp. KS1]